LDVDSIVKEVFKDKPTLDRSVIREEMNQNQDIQNIVAAEPIHEQIMRQLESIPSSTITLKDLNKAVAAVQKENGIQLTPAQTTSLVKSIFNSADDS
jgi:hypothetical protein